MANETVTIEVVEDSIQIIQVGEAAVWGSVAGTLSSQTDLQAELDAKENTGIAQGIMDVHTTTHPIPTSRDTRNEATGVAAGLDADHVADTTPHSIVENINHFKFNLTPTAVPTTEGTVSYNNGKLSIQNHIPGSLLQPGYEDWTQIKNVTGGTIPDGAVVVGIGSVASTLYPDEDVFTVALADASNANLSISVGICTADILNGEEGNAVTRGDVHNLDTTAWTAMAPLYVSDTIPGALTDVPPTPPSYAVPIGYAKRIAVDGSIYVYGMNPIGLINATDTAVLTGDPTGWDNPANIDVAYDSVARTVTITDTLNYTWRGQHKQLVSPWTSDPHPATLDTTYFLSSVDGVNFTWSTNVWEFSDLQVAFVWYGTLNKYGLREVHGVMPWQAHEEFHHINGTYRVSGGVLADYVLSSTVAADRRPSVSSTILKDEDIFSTNLLLPAGGLYTKMSLSGTGTSVFTTDSADIAYLSGSQPYYNEWNGAWVQTLVPNNTYTTIWLVGVPVTSDLESQKYRYVWVQGQTIGDLESQEGLFPANLNLGDFVNIFTEFVFLSKLILRFISGNWQIDKIEDLTGTRQSVTSSANGMYLSIVTHDTTLNGVGTVASPLSLLDATGVGFIPNGTAPVVTPVGGGYFYVEAGAFKYKGSSGTITVLGPA